MLILTFITMKVNAYRRQCVDRHQVFSYLRELRFLQYKHGIVLPCNLLMQLLPFGFAALTHGLVPKREPESNDVHITIKKYEKGTFQFCTFHHIQDTKAPIGFLNYQQY